MYPVCRLCSFTYCIDMICICNDSHSTAPDVHGGDDCPLVGLWAVILRCLEALVSVKSTTNVNLKEGALGSFTLCSEFSVFCIF